MPTSSSSTPSVASVVTVALGVGAVVCVALYKFGIIGGTKKKPVASSGNGGQVGVFTGVTPDWREFVLARKTAVSHDTIKLTFRLPREDQCLGLCNGQHIYARVADATGAMKQRPYTPTSPVEQRGSFDVVIKVYRPHPPTFPAGGVVSQLLDAVSVGQTVSFKPAKCHIRYDGDGEYSLLGKGAEGGDIVKRAEHLLLIAGGSGITPIFQVVQAISRNPSDLTRCTVIYSNRTENDILLREELERLRADPSKRFNVVFTLTGAAGSVPATWKGATGRVSAAMIRGALSADELATVQRAGAAFMCGPTGLVKDTVKPALAELGLDDPTRVLAF